MPSKQSKSEAGYIADAPAFCGNCSNYGGGSDDNGPCKIVEGKVAYYGCCNNWERGREIENEERDALDKFRRKFKL